MATLTEEQIKELSVNLTNLSSGLESFSSSLGEQSVISTDTMASEVDGATQTKDQLSGPTQVTSAEQFKNFTGVAPSEKQLEQLNAGLLTYNPSTGQVESAPTPPGTPTTGAAPVGQDDRTEEQKRIDQIISLGGVPEEDGTIRKLLTEDEQALVNLRKGEAEVQLAKDRLNNFETSLANDKYLQQLLRDTGAVFEERVKEMVRVNESRNAALRQLGFRLGGQQTGMAQFGGILSAEEEAGINRIAAIDAQKVSALAGAERAYRSEKWDQYVDLVDQAKKEYGNQVEAIQALNEATHKESQKVKDQELLSRKQAAIYNSLVQGTTDKADLFAKLKNEGFTDLTLKEVDEAFSVLAESFGLEKPKDEKEVESMATKLTGDAKNFFLLKENYPNSIPSFISELPEGEQLGAYMKWVESTTGKSKAGGESPKSLEFGSMVVRVARTAFGSGRALSDADRDFAKGLVEAGLAEGKSEYEIIDSVTGFNPQRNIPLANKLRQVIYQAAASGRGIQEMNLVPLSRALNEGDDARAITMAEDMAYEQARIANPERFMTEVVVRQQTELVNQLNTLLTDSGLIGEVGTFQGTFSKLITRRLRGERETEVMNRAKELVADMAKQMVGVNMTEAEMKFMEDLIPQIDEPAMSFNVKLRNLKVLPLARLNALRAERNMPRLDEKSLLDRKLRVPLYIGTLDTSAETSSGLRFNVVPGESTTPSGVNYKVLE